MRLTTLCYITEGDSVLMMLRNKKKGDVNRGKWIGVGGKFLPDESPDECVRREVLEETGLQPSAFHYCGVVTFLYEDAPAEYMHVYRAQSKERSVTSCDEGEMAWIPRQALSDLALWPGDRIFLPLVLDGAPAFSLKLRYVKDSLVEAVLNGKPVSLAQRE